MGRSIRHERQARNGDRLAPQEPPDSKRLQTQLRISCPHWLSQAVRGTASRAAHGSEHRLWWPTQGSPGDERSPSATHVLAPLLPSAPCRSASETRRSPRRPNQTSGGAHATEQSAFPSVYSRRLFREPARPQSIHENAKTVALRGRIVDAGRLVCDLLSFRGGLRSLEPIREAEVHRTVSGLQSSRRGRSRGDVLEASIGVATEAYTLGRR